MAEATGFDPANKIVKTSHGDISYDYLIIATGATKLFWYEICRRTFLSNESFTRKHITSQSSYSYI